MYTVVLDDDPTGTQSASGVTVLLDWTADDIADVLAESGSVYLQTNSRALDEATAVALARRVADEILVVEDRLGDPVQVVLRGDSTLRGHVFAESDVFAGDRLPIVFVPAFPAGGRRTVDAVHTLDIAGRPTPVGLTEYAADPVFGYKSSNLIDFVREKGRRRAVPVPLETLRSTRGAALVDVLSQLSAGEVALPDVACDEDILLIRDAIAEYRRTGRAVVVRSGAPLAAALAGAVSRGYLREPLLDHRAPVLVVCGSHTTGATRQLERLRARAAVEPVVLGTDAVFSDPCSEVDRAARLLAGQLGSAGLGILCSERVRRVEHDTLEHGRRVMAALTEVVSRLRSEVGALVTKGGITSAEVVRNGVGESRATVVGQIMPGVSVWRLAARDLLIAIVPGNVGDDEAMVDAVAAFGLLAGSEAATVRHSNAV